MPPSLTHSRTRLITPPHSFFLIYYPITSIDWSDGLDCRLEGTPDIFPHSVACPSTSSGNEYMVGRISFTDPATGERKQGVACTSAFGEAISGHSFFDENVRALAFSCVCCPAAHACPPPPVQLSVPVPHVWEQARALDVHELQRGGVL